jgi:hypothetical protein
MRLTRHSAICDYFAVTPHPAPHPESDPTLAVAERQLVQLRELVEIAMTAARAFGESAVAAAGAEKTILGEEWFTPEVGRARACGAKDASESIQKVTRSARLSMKLEMAVAEIVRDIRAGIVTHSADAISKDAGEAPGSEAGVPAGSGSPDRDTDWTRQDADTERLVEFDRPETLPRAALRETLEPICADLDVAIDWAAWKIRPPDPGPEASRPPPPDPSDARPPGIDLSP